MSGPKNAGVYMDRYLKNSPICTGARRSKVLRGNAGRSRGQGRPALWKIQDGAGETPLRFMKNILCFSSLKVLS